MKFVIVEGSTETIAVQKELVASFQLDGFSMNVALPHLGSFTGMLEKFH